MSLGVLMKPDSDTPGWKQHFPTYDFNDRDIALEEYRFATKVLEAEERVFLNAANLALILGAALGSLALGTLDRIITAFAPLIPPITALNILLLVAWFFGAISVRYFADRQKAVVFAARKVIVLRRMLGMNYGSLQLVLPNWRVEGADEPFAVRLFPGWRTYVSYPCFAIALASSAITYFLVATAVKLLQDEGFIFTQLGGLFVLSTTLTWFLGLCWVYRKALLDTHETADLLFAKVVARLVGLGLVEKVEYVIYRATLAKYELNRLRVDLSRTKRLLVQIEDKEFFSHRGTSWRGIGRMLLSGLGLRRPSGGSTITQQLVRTLFIQEPRKTIRRKMLELVLAKWMTQVVGKDEQLSLYLASVRFEHGVYGIADAMKFFFGKIVKTPTASESFFLIERVSNIKSGLLVEKIDETLRAAVKSNILSPDDARGAVALFRRARTDGKLSDALGNGVERLEAAW